MHSSRDRQLDLAPGLRHPVAESEDIGAARSMLLCLVKEFAQHFLVSFLGSEKDRERAVCWIADKTGKVHSGEGKLL